MIKTVIILGLIVVLAAGASISRPSKASFDQLIRDKMTADAGNILDKILLEHRIKSYLDDCKYNDHLLWVDVTKGGEKIYTGAFSKWFESTAAKKTAATMAGPMKSIGKRSRDVASRLP
jgi:hypothetical protein